MRRDSLGPGLHVGFGKEMGELAPQLGAAEGPGGGSVILETY